MSVHPLASAAHKGVHPASCVACSGKTVPPAPLRVSYAQALVVGTDPFALQHALRRIETHTTDACIDEVSHFCEKCMAVRVISYDAYSDQTARIVESPLASSVYTDETLYYLSRVVLATKDRISRDVRPR